MAQEELVQVVDEQDQPVGGKPIGLIRQRGIWHRVARVMIDDGHGNLLLQQRSHDNRLFPGRWDNSAAGVVAEGEDYAMCAIRELEEEMGISRVSLTELGKFNSSSKYKDLTLNEWQMVYRASVPMSTPLKLQASEVSGAKWLSMAEVKQLAAEHPERMTTGLKEALRRYY